MRFHPDSRHSRRRSVRLARGGSCYVHKPRRPRVEIVRYRTTSRFAGTPAARTQTHRARQYTAPTASPAAAIDALQTHDARSGPHPLGRALELRAPPFVDSAPGDIPYPLHTIPSPFRQAINPPSPISPSLRCSRLAARRRPRTCRPSRAASSRAQDPS